MKTHEILSALPQWAKAAPETIVASPAWRVPFKTGETQCVLLSDGVRPAETLDIAVRLENDRHVLGIADSEAFPELHAVWSERSAVPESVLLALVEKDCGPFFQALENCARRQLKVDGLAAPGGASAADAGLCLRAVSGEKEIFTFTITPSPALLAAIGQLRYIDHTHLSVRETPLDAEIEIAAMAIPEDDIAGLASGDAILLPEMEGAPEAFPPSARILAAGLFAVSPAGVEPLRPDAMFHVVLQTRVSIALGEIFDCAETGAQPAALSAALPRGAPLRLVKSGVEIAAGRLGAVGSMPAFVKE